MKFKWEVWLKNDKREKIFQNENKYQSKMKKLNIKFKDIKLGRKYDRQNRQLWILDKEPLFN